MTFFTRTNYDGSPMGDTSNMFGHPHDFVYNHDQTCGRKDTRGIRKILVFDIQQIYVKCLFKF